MIIGGVDCIYRTQVVARRWKEVFVVDRWKEEALKHLVISGVDLRER